MANAKTEGVYSDALIMAFVTCDKRDEICKKAGISKSSYYNKLKDKTFMKLVSVGRQEIVREAVRRMESYLLEDVEILQSFARNKDERTQVRINSIQLLLNQLAQWKQVTELEEQIRELQEAVGIDRTI